MSQFKKILVANRGEIACRVIRSARELGYSTVAIYSDADAGARHVRLADEAVRIGAAPVLESYLCGDRILAAAAQTGADAVHPGYGFLSENAVFAKACEDAGVVFIGPPVAAIESMGSKRESKRLMEAAGVPCVPGFAGDTQDEAELMEAAASVGFPVMIKASMGGGGRGMRLVESPDELPLQLRLARSEAANAFGCGELILERAVINPRHIEFQIFADTKGSVIHLGERDCSIQRRHQKVVEEAPSPFMDSALREAMGEAAVNAARACGYVGAGTVEFLVDDARDFFFLEMNTRLQVEHPVTEEVTGTDLVAWQLKVAAGEPLPLTQEEVELKGHAIEVRLYAEEPALGFLPQTGTISCLTLPRGEGIRVDHGLDSNQRITPDYDPMLAKVIAVGSNREMARRRLIGALSELSLFGVRTNQAFLKSVLESERFSQGEVTTGFIELEYPAGFPSIVERLESVGLYGAVAAALYHRDETALSGQAGRYGWSNGKREESLYLLEVGGEELRFGLCYCFRTRLYRWRLEGEMETSGEFSVVQNEDGSLQLSTEGRVRRLEVGVCEDVLSLKTPCGVLEVRDLTRRPANVESGAGSGRVVAAMDGAILSVEVVPGDAVVKGQTVVVLEAMKMEHALKSEVDGVVESVQVTEGDQVKGRELLLEIGVVQTEGGGEEEARA